jgi:hypothetical protein
LTYYHSYLDKECYVIVDGKAHGYTKEPYAHMTSWDCLNLVRVVYDTILSTHFNPSKYE